MAVQPSLAKIQEIRDLELDKFKIRLLVKREDLLHPYISGNKFRKLKYNVREAIKQGHHTLLTFGGAYSNHIYTTAAAGREYGFRTIGVIRGEEHLPLNHTLQFAVDQGMLLHYINRNDYKRKDSPERVKALKEQFGKFYLLPEGGTNLLAVRGCTEIMEGIGASFDIITTPCGTGGTMAGLVSGLNNKQWVIGFSALKGGKFLVNEVKIMVKKYTGKEFDNWEINTDYHFGGYAKIKPELISFINSFKHKTGIPLDPIYTGKMFYGIYDLAKKGYFRKNTTVLALHTGGLQGIEGFKERYGLII